MNAKLNANRRQFKIKAKVLRSLFIVLFIYSSTCMVSAQTFIGTTASDGAPLGLELLSTSNWTSTGWTGGFVSGWTNNSNNTSALTNTQAALVSTNYQIGYTITGRTTGSITITFGGIVTSGITATDVTGVRASTTGNLIITPTNNFNGTVVLSLKTIGTASASTTFSSSDSVPRIEIRASNVAGNTFIGLSSGRKNTTGFNNTFLGATAGQSNSTGYYNSFVGQQSGSNNTAGYANTFQGYVSGMANSYGNYNTNIGYAAGINNTTGSSNVLIGSGSGRYIADGVTPLSILNTSILIGANAKSLANNLSNQIVIGYGGTSLGANTTVLGNATTTTTAIYGNLLLGTTLDSAYKLYVNGTSKFAGSASVTGLLDVANNIKFSGALMPNNSAGTAGQVLTSAGAGLVPTWTTLASGGNWGTITGSLASQVDLQNALDLKATIASPALVGIPTAPTAAPGTNTTQIATTAFVNASSGWSLTGNTGTNTATNFVGTGDSTDLILKTNNLERLRILGNGKTSVLHNNWLKSINNIFKIGDDSYNLFDISTNGVNTVFTFNGNNIQYGPMWGLAIEQGYETKFRSGAYASYFSFSFGNWERMRILQNGNVGFGTITPTATVDIAGTFKLQGNGAASGKVLTSDALGNASWQTITGGSDPGWGQTGNTGTDMISNFIGTTDNVGIAFRTNNINRLQIGATGNVGIGTIQISDTSYRLFVEKGIHTRKIKVDALSWADYVFSDDYKLQPLSEVGTFIQQHKHLPGVYSTAEVEKNGVDVGETQAMLLKKVEELTLYLIELDKKVALLTKENQQLKAATIKSN